MVTAKTCDDNNYHEEEEDKDDDSSEVLGGEGGGVGVQKSDPLSLPPSGQGRKEGPHGRNTGEG